MIYTAIILWGTPQDPEGERMDFVAAMISDYE